MKKHTDLNYDPSMLALMRDTQRTLVEQPDFRGIGMHGPETGSHGLHSQVSIGIGDTTVNFRQLGPLPPLSFRGIEPTTLPKGPDPLAPWRW